MTIKQIRKATATKKATIEARNADLYIKDMAEGLTAAEMDEMDTNNETISNLDAILNELTAAKSAKLDENTRALVAANID